MEFKAVQKTNPIKPKEEKKWYAQIVLGKEASIGELVEDIEKFSALSEPDIRGVIIALENVVQRKLAEGRIVRFEQLGSLYPSLLSNASEKEEKLTADNIKGVKVNYRPGKRIIDAMEAAPKKKVKVAEADPKKK